ncbi:MAG: pyridoxal phosphate-dependent aminotransferase [Phycisphaerales bacterium]|nr:pyridoxal phosphate-dependent aminotransferase [Phycisphaerales bacterium]
MTTLRDGKSPLGGWIGTTMRIDISERLAALRPSAPLAVVDKARAMRDRGVDVVDFSAGQPDFDTPQHVKDAAVAALAAGDTKYPTPTVGKNELREAVRNYFKRYCGLDYKLSETCVTVGAKDALHLAFAAILNPGDEVVVPVPYWGSYIEHIHLAGGVTRRLTAALAQNGKFTAAQLREQITPKTKALIVNSPSNPSGAVFTRAEFAELAKVLADTNILVISDEIYHRLCWTGETCASFASLPGMFERTVTINGASKSYAMTGWRLGFAGGPEPIIAAMSRLQGQTTSGATSFVQTAAITALNGDQFCVSQMAAAYHERGKRMHAGLSAIAGVRCAMPDGAFYCFPDVSGVLSRVGAGSVDEFANMALEKAHVAVVSGSAFGSDRHVRMSFACGLREVDEGVRRFAAFLK